MPALEETEDITWLVVHYIPLGSSFDDAEAILRGAGFSVRPKPASSQSGNQLGEHGVMELVNDDRSDSSRTNIYLFLSANAWRFS
ncbi:hypothetical protein [Burkholderia seminalis]|uniref:hypothetical protein n=1 Tax=Burkholderia seminalis TaxID=488731 RepID=UPI001904608E|nr:hypothetical protein [Burkholderia seminalis]MBJ9965339.1 hypothetical protein [Burkholderia seminalis]